MSVVKDLLVLSCTQNRSRLRTPVKLAAMSKRKVVVNISRGTKFAPLKSITPNDTFGVGVRDVGRDTSIQCVSLLVGEERLVRGTVRAFCGYVRELGLLPHEAPESELGMRNCGHSSLLDRPIEEQADSSI